MQHDVIIVGAGAAGIGMGATLIDFGINNFKVIDRHEAGSSFSRWPAEMRLITPSFNTTPFGILDLNAVTLNTSVANFLGVEHPTGKQYASYLQGVVRGMQIPVEKEWDVKEVEEEADGGFLLKGAAGTASCDFLIWAAGEFQFPRQNQFSGAELCLHNSLISSYAELEGDDFLIIGAFESGVDAAVNLTEYGKKVTLLCADEVLSFADQDPSRSLSPYTRQRLKSALKKNDNLRISYRSKVEKVTTNESGFAVYTETGEEFSSPVSPILATGFRGGMGPVEHLFDYHEEGYVQLSEDDESTYANGLFLAGPLVRHEHHIFCYIYKFRQRFAVIAETIATRLGISVPDELLETYERNQMRLLDLSCCGQECVC